jgi:hypothetical protein
MENKVTVKRINNLKVRGKIIEEPDPDHPSEKIKKLFTEVTFNYEGTPGRFDDVLTAITTDTPVDVTFQSLQCVLDLDPSKEVSS